RVIPDHADVSIGAGLKRKILVRDLLLRQVEERALALEQRPMRAITAAFEREPLEERRRDTRDPNAIDGVGGTEVGLETARGLGRRNRQDPANEPARLSTPLHEEVWDRPAGRFEEPEIVQAAIRHHRLAALRHA